VAAVFAGNAAVAAAGVKNVTCSTVAGGAAACGAALAAAGGAAVAPMAAFAAHMASLAGGRKRIAARPKTGNGGAVAAPMLCVYPC
jgi:hypothetical protein